MFKRITAVGAALLISASSLALAQDDYPSRAMTLIIPYQSGGSTETFARLITDDVATILEEPIIIMPRPGASGTIGARAVADAKPDGYTLLGNTSQHVIYDAMLDNLPFDPMNDFVPVGLLGSAPILVVTSADSPFKTFKDAVEASKKDTVTFASGAHGSLPHLTGERAALQAGADMMHIAFSGAAPALTSAMGGHVDLFYSTAASVMQQIYAGQLRPLAVSSKERMSELPDVPTIAEEIGDENFDVTAWYAVWAPKGTDPKIVERFNTAMIEASSKPETQERMKQFSVNPSFMTAAQFSEFIDNERRTWIEVIEKADIKAEQ